MSGESKNTCFFLLKTLVLSYVVTALCLLLLALLLYKLHLGQGPVSIAVIAIYVVSTAFAGILAGKRMKSRKFLWGLLLGALYFLVLAVVSLLTGHGESGMGSSFFTTLILCAAGGMLGGMIANLQEIF